MITTEFILTIFLVSSIVCNILFAKKVFQLYKLSESCLMFIDQMKSVMTKAKEEIDLIDKKGSFSSDDEVGFAFKVINTAITDVDEYVSSFQSK